MKTGTLSSLALRALLRPTFVLGGLALLVAPVVGMMTLCRYQCDAEAATSGGIVALTPRDWRRQGYHDHKSAYATEVACFGGEVRADHEVLKL